MKGRLALIILATLIAFIGVAGATGTYTVYYKNIASINDTLYLDFVSSVSNATITFQAVGFAGFDNANGGVWTEYMSFPITVTPTDYANYKIVINGSTWELYNTSGGLEASGVDTDFWSLVNSTGADIRVFNDSGVQLFFWIESWDYANQTAVIWVNLSAGSQELNIAYGNPSATKSAYCNVSKTFLFGDDFDNGVLDTSKWVLGYATYGAPSYSEANGVLKVWSDGVNWTALHANYTIPNSSLVVAEARIQLLDTDGNGHVLFFASADNADTARFGVQEDGSSTTGNNMSVEYLVSGTYYYSGILGNVGTSWFRTKIVKNGLYSFTAYLYDDSGNLLGSFSNTSTAWTNDWWITIWVRSAYGQEYDWIIVYKLSDPADFGTPSVKKFGVLNPRLVINGNTVQYTGFIEVGSSVTLPVNSTYFTTTNSITITSDPQFGALGYMNATLQFDYAFSATVTIKDYYSYIYRNCVVNTSSLATSINFSQIFPKRTSDYNLAVTSSPTTSYTTTETPDSIIVTLTLNPATTYTITEEVGYLIATFTAKDELTQASISNFTITYESISGTSTKTTTTGVIKLYGDDIKLSKQFIVLSFNATGYSVRKRIIDQTLLNQTITLWLLSQADSSYVTFTVVDGISTVYQAKVTVQKYINGAYETLFEGYTDMAGSVSVPLKVYDSYRIIVSKEGYQSVILDIEINQLTYTIQIGGGNLTVSYIEPAFVQYIIYPIGNTLVEGNTTFSFVVTPKSGYTLSEAGILLYINGTLVASNVTYNVASRTTLTIEHYVNSSMNITVVAYWVYSGQKHQITKTYIVPNAVGLWAVFVALNGQLATTSHASLIATLIATFITLLVVCSLAYYTTLPPKGLGFVALVTFTLIAAPLHAVSMGVLAVMWLVAIAMMVVWR